MKLNKVVLLICTLILVVTFSIGSTLAYFVSEEKKVNHFSIGSVEVDIQEDFPIEGSDWSSGQVIKKEVAIKNTGSTPVLVRAQLIPYWLDGDVPFVAGDTSKIIFEYGALVTEENIGPESWILGSDGFYYYTSVLPAGKETPLLLKSVKLPEKLSSFYEGKKLMVDVEVEAIQATQEAYKEAWMNLPEEIGKMLDSLVNSETDKG